MESLFFSYRRIAWLKDITESGSSFAQSESEKRNIILTNGIAIVGSLAVVALMIFRAVFHGTPLQSVQVWLYFAAVIFTLPVLLNRKGWTTLSRIAMCSIPPLLIIVVAYFVLHKETATVASYVGIRYFLLGLCCPPFLIFDVPRERMFMIALAVPLTIIILFDPILSALGVGYSGEFEVDYSFNNVRAAVSAAVISVCCYMLKSRADRNEALTKNLISELALKNEEIQRQASDRVHQLNEELFKHVQQLREREFILNQSQRIAKIGSWEYTIEGTSLFWSDEMYNIFGLDRSFYIQANNLGDIIGGEAGQAVISATEDLIRTGQPFDLTTRIRMPLGYVKWLRLYAYPVRENEKVLGVRGICHDITYYKEAEELLRSRDKKYRSLFEQASDAIIVTDFKGNFTDANTSFRKMFGYSLEELLGMNIADVIEQEESIRRPIMFDILEEGVQIFNERRMVSKQGTVRDVEANVKKIDDRLVMAIIRDVTELRRVQQQIQISEARFRGAFEYSAIGMCIVSLEGHWLRVNREFLHLIGYNENEVIGRQFREITHPDDLDVNLLMFEETVKGIRETYRMEKRYIHKNGRIIWVRLNVSMIKDDRAKPLYCVAQIEDVTQEREATEQLLISQANLRATINNTDILIWSVDREYKLLTFNKTFAKYIWELAGIDPTPGLYLFGHNIPDNRFEDRWKEWYDRVFTGEAIQQEEDGHRGAFQYSLSPIHEGDKVIGASIFAENITKRKEHDRALAEANKKIEELKLMALRSVMSPHFVFNVLNSIQFFIARNDRLNAINYLSTFSKLIRSILNQSISNRIKLSEEVDMLKNYVHLEMTRFEEKFNFVLDVHDDVDLETIEIPSLLIQPYVENAILHGLYNKKSPGTLTVRVKKGEGSVVFEIEDDGVGRAEAMRVRAMNFPSHKSMGVRLTEERLKLIKTQNNAALEIEDLEDQNGEPSGTKVSISIPY